MTNLPALVAMLLGNFVVGVSVLGPAGMITELAQGLGVTIQTAGLLVTFGAVVLCVASPLLVWRTSRMDRRVMLGGTIAVLAVGHFASALAPSYGVLLALRLGMLAVAAIFTPQAASTVTLMTSERERSGAISFVFLGWSSAVALGLPLVALSTTQWGWRGTYVVIGLIATASGLLLWTRLPRGLKGQPVDLSTWGALARNRLVLLLLSITALWLGGQFVVFPYVAPLLADMAGASGRVAALLFALYGFLGVAGNLAASRLVGTWGPYATSRIFLVIMMAGALSWLAGAGNVVAMGMAMGLWGLGFAAFNSMQQARLIAAAPDLGSASVALNTSAIYVGQGMGSAIGGALYSAGRLETIGIVATAFMAAALVGLLMSRPRQGQSLLGG
jgi:predicted MFS family arabinose efflux permease